MNELAYLNGHQPLNDEVLSQLILREAKGHPSALRLVLPKGHPQRKKLSKYRGAYNLYRQGKEFPAACISFRYNADGKRIGNHSKQEVGLLKRDKEEDIFWTLLRRNFPGQRPTDLHRMIYVAPPQEDRVLQRLQSMLAGQT